MESTTPESPEKKDVILRTLAALGFLGALGLIAWLSVQLVHSLAPTVGSLASLAEGVNQYQESIIDSQPDVMPLTVTSATSLLNAGDSLAIEWSRMNADGDYYFSYECTDGVSITLELPTGSEPHDCATSIALGEAKTATLVVESEKNRYADVPYTISFVRPNGVVRAAGKQVLTIVNADITSQFAYNQSDDVTPPLDAPEPEPIQVPEPAVEEEAPVVTPEPQPTLTAPSPAPLTVAVPTVPTSDPNGYSDLATTFVAMGEIINGAFVAGPVSVQNDGAVQFSIKNQGTKTSQDWSYSIILPNGQTHTATNQRELKPNERAVITIGFPAGGDTTHTFVMIVTEETDINNSNNSFRQTVAFAE